GEHPFAILKYAIFGHPRFLLRGLEGTRSEMSLATMAYNLKRMLNLMGAALQGRAAVSKSWPFRACRAKAHI
ncbi:MAG: hypothetical protein DMG95_12645, partial [Acidobacteria bacterium]